MKQGKKALALALAVVLMLAMGVTAFAADDGKITIDNAINGEKYNLYKVFDLTYSGDGETNATGTTDTTATAGTYTGVAYTYKASGTTDAFLTELQKDTSPFTADLVSGSTDVYAITRKTTATDDAIISFVKDNISKLPSDRHIGTEATAANNKVEWTGLAYGYYYVTSSVGTFVTIDSTLKEVTVKEKNTVPSQDKKQGTTEGTYDDVDLNVKVGDTIYYQVEITDGKGTNAEIKLTDTMTSGLTRNQDVTVYKGGTEETNKVTAGEDTYAITYTDNGFVLTLKAAYVSTLGENDKVYVRYSAQVNENAVTKSEEVTANPEADPSVAAVNNNNTSQLEYSQQTTTDTVYFHTYKFQLVKDDNQDTVFSDTATEGKYATFKLYTTQTGGDPIMLVETADGYRPAKVTNATTNPVTYETGATDTIKAGYPIFKGFAPGTYYFEETSAPRGYNKLTERKSITIDSTSPADNIATFTKDSEDKAAFETGAKYKTGGLEVENQSGTELPSTGGIGTTIFYIVGAILVIGAGVLLITRRRMRAE